MTTILTDEEYNKLLSSIKGNINLIPPPLPILPVFNKSINIYKRLKIIQEFISSFEYNFTEQNYFNISKLRSYAAIMKTSKEIIYTALPIKCMEAVMLALFLTTGTDYNSLLKLPVRFKSMHQNHTYRHIVLIVRYNNKYGALGLSRKSTLEYKECIYNSLSEIIKDYKLSYENIGHRLKRVSFGIPVDLDEYSPDFVTWNFLINVIQDESDWDKIFKTMDNYIIECDKHKVNTKLKLLSKSIPNCLTYGSKLFFVSPTTNTTGIKIKEDKKHNLSTAESDGESSDEEDDSENNDTIKTNSSSKTDKRSVMERKNLFGV